ncbi:transport permease protein [Acrocarpospora pleiomorpha]|uniref:Transport permease protein n=1 Tax=Acrocarpospora pleiomorpha TaxID=90975 RepID=A0A5M3XS72_9ACTN|nr:transport permease protein [Acrocarpospora pleiomorpha]
MIARRYLTHIPRIPALVFFTIVQPIIFILLFSIVFGNAIRVPGGDYTNFLLPGIFVQTMAFATMGTCVGLAEDLHKGLVDRFRALPMARSAVLVGRLLSDTVKNALILVIMIVVGYIVGFRITNGFFPALAGILLLLLFAFAFATIGAWIGLSMKSVEAANMAGMVWVFPLTFVSSVFVPVNSMPLWIRPFAHNHPVTATVDALRGLFHGGPTLSPLIKSLVWCVLITAICLTGAITTYKRVSSH